MKLDPRLKFVLLVCAGVVIGTGIAEVFIRICRGAPSGWLEDEYFYRYHIDVNEPFFKKDKSGTVYINQRPGSVRTVFDVRKKPDERRIFVVGEDLANDFDTNVLAAKCREAMPGYNWTVVNCGMDGYDSYRTMLVTREIVQYEPDLIILITGANEGLHDPVMINHWLTRCRPVSYLWTTRILSSYIAPPLTVPEEKRGKFFERNVRRILKIAERRDIPVALCSVPVNIGMASDALPLSDKEVFAAWWLLSQNPWNAERYMRAHGFGKTATGGPRYPWFLAKAYAYMEERPRAEEYYRLNGSPAQAARDMTLKRLQREAGSGVMFVDVAGMIEQISEGNQWFGIFRDRYHCWQPVYAAVCDRLLEAVYRHNLAEDGAVLAALPEWKHADYRTTGISYVANHSRFEAQRRTYDFPYTYDDFMSRYRGNNDFISRCETLRYHYEMNPARITKFTEFEKFRRYSRKKGYDDEAVSRGFAVTGEVLREDCEYAQALRYLDEAIRIDPGNRLAYLLKGLCLYDMGQKDAAERHFIETRRFNGEFGWLSVGYLDTIAGSGR